MIILEISPIYQEAFQLHRRKDSRVQSKIEVFLRAKLASPAEKIPRGMKDHSLYGKLDGLRECHICGNILLVYSLKSNCLRLIWICTHDELWTRVTLINRNR